MKLSFLYYFHLFTFLCFINILSGITDSDNKIKFIVAGHLYGEGDRPKIYPQTTLLANIDFINSLNPHFFISLGDNVANGDDLNQVEGFNKIFVSKLNVPFYTAWGNHDGERTKLRSRLKSPTYFSFTINNSVFIFLDTELNNKELNGEMLIFFIRELIKSFKNIKTENIFILSHKLIWATDHAQFKIVVANSNESSIEPYHRFKFFMKKVNKIIKEKPLEKKLFWVSGDIGKFYSLPLLYHKDSMRNIEYIATGIGDTNNDLILNFEIESKKVKIEAYSLLSNKLVKTESFNLAVWNNYFSYCNYLKVRFLRASRIKLLVLSTFFGLVLGVLTTYYYIKYVSPSK
jgi:hypothetical protein